MKIDGSPADYGKPNPSAHPRLGDFAFLIGEWRCAVRWKGNDGGWEKAHASWAGRYILDGYAIADEFRMFASSGELIMLGSNYRSYGDEPDCWVMKWHDALTSRWMSLGPEELGGVKVEGDSITFKARLEPNLLHRITFSNIAEDHFTWRADSSADGGKTWDESVMVIEAHREA